VRFSKAFETIRNNPNVAMRLPHWKDPMNVIKVQCPDKYSKMTHPYLYAESSFGRVPWQNTVPELFSEMWEVVATNEDDEYVNTFAEDYEYDDNIYADCIEEG
jgi:hypothetical protein